MSSTKTKGDLKIISANEMREIFACKWINAIIIKIEDR